jgi:hypothetical protein
MNTAPNPNMAAAIAAPDQAKARRSPADKALVTRILHRPSRSGAWRTAHGGRNGGRRSRCDAWHPETIGEGHRERREVRRDQPLLHDFNGEKHQAQGFRRGHAGGADGLRSCDGDEMCLSPRECGRHRPARQCRAHIRQARPDVSRADRGAQPLSKHGEPAITMQTVSVQDGGKAIVGNVTQHASVILSDISPAPAVTAARMVPMPQLSEREHEPADARRRAPS